MASYYACYLITFFFLAGDYVRARTDSSLRPAALAVSLVLSFCTGMQSLRQTCVSILPILAVEAVSAMRSLIAREGSGQRGGACPLCRAIGYTAANIGGVLLMKLLGVPNQSIYSDASVLDGTGLNGKLWRFIAASRTVSGFECVKNNGGFFRADVRVLHGAADRCGGDPDTQSQDRARGIRGAYWWLSVVSLLAVIAASFFTTVKLRAIYLFIYYPLLALSAAIVLSAPRRLRCAMLIALCVLSAGNIYFSYGDDLRGVLAAKRPPRKSAATPSRTATSCCTATLHLTPNAAAIPTESSSRAAGMMRSSSRRALSQHKGRLPQDRLFACALRFP